MNSLDRIRSRAEGRRRGEYRSFEHVRPGLCFVQGDQSIANQAGAAFRGDLNNELQALVTLSSGAAAPGTTYAHQLWADTTSNLLKKRNAANSAWIVVRTLHESFVVTRAANTILGVSDVGKTIIATAAFTQTFTAAATLGDGWYVDYVNTGASTSVTFDPNGAETINGVTTLAFGPGESGTIYCNGSSFQIVARSRYAGTIASGRNIQSRTNAGTPNTKIDISADELQLKDANGNVKVATSVSLTIDYGTTGANGIDSGVQVLNTWYYNWVIAKEDGTVAGLGSVSSSAPTMPSGYTYKALVNAARSDASVHFLPYRQFGNTVYYESRQAIVTAGAATVETSVATSSFVPPNALATQIFVENAGQPSAAGQIDTLNIRVVTGVNVNIVTTQGQVANQNVYNSAGMEIPNLSQNVFYLFGVAQQNVHSATIYVNGFKLPLGGE